MYATDVRMEFKRITEKAGLGQDWTPRELRHTFVSLLSDSGVPIEQIADAVGHSTPGQPRSCTGTSSGRSPVLRPSRWVRCSRAKERATEAKAEPLGYQLGFQDLIDRE
jgi:hypothetical protein